MSEEVVLRQEIDKVKARATAIKQSIKPFEAEAEHWASTRNSLNDKCRKTREEIRSLKAERDSLNDQVKRLKAKREGLRVRLRERLLEYNALRKKIRTLTYKTHLGEPEALARIKGLEWKIQTTPLKPREENRIIDTIRGLEREVLLHREISLLKSKLRSLSSEVEAIKLRISEVSTEIDSIAKESREKHIQMMERIGDLARFKAEADEAHKSFLESLKKAMDKRSRYLGCMCRLKDLTSQLKTVEDEKRKRMAEEEAEAKCRTAAEKLKNKRKMSFEEFKALMERGLV